MLSHRPIKRETRTTRGVVLITLLLSVFVFSGFESRGPTREVESVKTEWVAKASRQVARVSSYKVAGQKSLFTFYPFFENEFLSSQNNRVDTMVTRMAHQCLSIQKIFSRHYQVYPSRSSEDDIIKSLRG